MNRAMVYRARPKVRVVKVKPTREQVEYKAREISGVAAISIIAVVYAASVVGLFLAEGSLHKLCVGVFMVPTIAIVMLSAFALFDAIERKIAYLLVKRELKDKIELE